MAGMVRRQIYLRPEQDEALKRRAQALGISESELIRRSIDQAQPPERPAQPAAESQPPSAERRRPSPEWEEFIRFMKARGELPSTGEGRTWTREELYDRPKHWNSG